jgi:hypothetical protein
VKGNSPTPGFETLRASLQLAIGATAMVPQQAWPSWLNTFSDGYQVRSRPADQFPLIQITVTRPDAERWVYGLRYEDIAKQIFKEDLFVHSAAGLTPYYRGGYQGTDGSYESTHHVPIASAPSGWKT